LLAALDERHSTLSGPATKKLCERALTIFRAYPVITFSEPEQLG